MTNTPLNVTFSHKDWLTFFDNNKKPFNPHIISQQLNQHEKNQYAVLHNAFILFNGSISKEQERLYHFWLAAISPDLNLADIAKQAQEYQEQDLQNALNLLNEHQLSEVFLLDVFVFSFMSGALSSELSAILNEWCNFFALDQATLEQLVALSQHILGNTPQAITADDYTPAFKRCLAVGVWTEFFATVATAEQLTHAEVIEGGIWYINQHISVAEQNIHLNNAIVLFDNTLTTTSLELTLTNSLLINPLLSIDNSTVTIDNCRIEGSYNPQQKQTAIKVDSNKKIAIKNTRFNTHNARALYFNKVNSNATFTDCHFESCGNKTLVGGAVYAESGVYFKQCKFKNCHAFIGGAVAMNKTENTVFNKCLFENCTSEKELQAYSNATKQVGAIYVCYAKSNLMEDSTIRGDLYICKSSSYYQFKNTFISGLLMYSDGNFSEFFDGSSEQINANSPHYVSCSKALEIASFRGEVYQLVTEEEQ